MKTFCLYYFAVSLSAALHGQEIAGGRHVEMHRAILEGFSFIENQTLNAVEEVPIAGSAQTHSDEDIIILDKLVVNGRMVYRDLEADMKKARPRHAQSHSKFGTGVHEKDFGKVRVSALTILYIPIWAGASW